MTDTLALLSLLDGPRGSDPAFHVIRSRFRQMKRFLAQRPEEGRISTGCWIMFPQGLPGHGPIHLFVTSALEMCFHWIRNKKVGSCAGLPPLRMTSGQSSISRKLHSMPGKSRLPLTPVKGKASEYCIDIVKLIFLCISPTT